MNSPRTVLRLGLLLLPVLSLIPVGLITVDWLEFSGILPASPSERYPRAYDWVHWAEADGAVEAVFVYPNGPGAVAGVQEGDVLFDVADHQLYSAEDVKDIIEGLEPGTGTTYTVQRSEGLLTLDVTLGRYPTFLYPLSSALWYTSVWGFTLGAFLHILALLIVLPLALRSPSAFRSAALILASSIWVMGNLARMLWILLLGPEAALSHATLIGFQVLTHVSLLGWIAFPLLLVLHVLADLPERARPARPWRVLLWVPPMLFAGVALASTLRDHVGPLTLDNLVGPILFYVSCYVAAATGLSLWANRSADAPLATRSGWSRLGTTAVFLFSTAAALLVLGLLPATESATDTTVGWSIMAVQLLSVLPVGLESFATLQYGKINEVLSRSLTYLLAIGGLFFATVGGLFLLDPVISRLTIPQPLTIGAFVVVLLLVFDQVVKAARPLLQRILTTDRQRAQQRLIRFFDRMRSLLDAQMLIQQTVDRVGAAMDARWARIYITHPDDDDRWLSATYAPGATPPPRFARARLWGGFDENGMLWSRNPELNDASLPAPAVDELIRGGAAVAIPVPGERRPTGLVILGERRRRRGVFNITDMDLLRATCNQLALALVRIRLVEREKELVRESAEAELVALRAQINPHFLFNTLNTIASLVEERPEQAEQTVEHLAAIFRHILQVGGQPFVRLDTEIDQVRRYLEIEQARFGERLRVEIEVHPDARTWLVPAFALQTLVENAVLHGIGRTVRGGLVRIETDQPEDDMLEIRVIDTGRGIPGFDSPVSSESKDGAPSFYGIGLRNVAGRLEKLYGRADLLIFESRAGQGTTVRLRLPATEARAPVVSPSGRLRPTYSSIDP